VDRERVDAGGREWSMGEDKLEDVKKEKG